MGSLLSQLLGSPDLSNIDNKIDDIIQNLNNPNSKSTTETESKNLDDVTGDFLNLFQKEKDKEGENGGEGTNGQFDQLFQNMNVPAERLQRYNLYDELYQSVPMMKRILTVYISNIVPKNPVNDDVFIYTAIENKQTSDSVNLTQQKEQYKEIVKKFNLSNRLKKYILPYRLKYGDYFVEVINVDEMLSTSKLKQVLTNTSTSVISECKRINNKLDTTANAVLTEDAFDQVLSSTSKMLFDYSDYDSDLTNMMDVDELKEVFSESGSNVGVICDAEADDKNGKETVKDIENDNVREQEKADTINFDNVLLRYHLPHNIIILETKYGTTLGYLEVNKDKNDTGASSISSMVQKVVSKGKNNQQQNVDKLIQHVLHNIFHKSITKSKKSIDSVISSLSPDVFNFIKRLIIENDLTNDKNISNVNKIKVRFIPPKSMVHFSNPDGSDYLPFASSVLDPLLLPGKLYMLTQLSNIITKLSRASVIRKWTLDMGSSKMSAQNLQKLKKEIYNTRVTLNDLGSFKSISKILSDFRDMFTISQNGRTPVDMSIEQTGDPNIKTEDLKDLRNELVSMSGIPATFLGMNDVIELREQLVHINQNFATEISNHQDNDIRALNDLMKKICNNLGYDDKTNPTNFYRITLIPPITLILQLIETTLQSIGNISSIFNQLEIPVDPYHLLENYLPQIDWDTFKKKAETYKMKNDLKEAQTSGGGNDGGGGSQWG